MPVILDCGCIGILMEDFFLLLRYCGGCEDYRHHDICFRLEPREDKHERYAVMCKEDFNATTESFRQAISDANEYQRIKSIIQTMVR